jgi:hypothetical protein
MAAPIPAVRARPWIPRPPNPDAQRTVPVRIRVS